MLQRNAIIANFRFCTKSGVLEAYKILYRSQERVKQWQKWLLSPGTYSQSEGYIVFPLGLNSNRVVHRPAGCYGHYVGSYIYIYILAMKRGWLTFTCLILRTTACDCNAWSLCACTMINIIMLQSYYNYTVLYTPVQPSWVVTFQPPCLGIVCGKPNLLTNPCEHPPITTTVDCMHTTVQCGDSQHFWLLMYN